MKINHLIIDEYRDILRDIVISGVNRTRDVSGDRIAIYSPTTRASMTHDEMVNLAKERLLISEDVRFVFYNGRDLFIVHDKIAIQFKKLREDLRPCNYATASAVEFNNGENIDLPGIRSSIPSVTVGYTVDKDDIDINGIFAVCRYNGQIEWTVDLNGAYLQNQENFDDKLIVHEPEVQPKKVGIPGGERKANAN